MDIGTFSNGANIAIVICTWIIIELLKLIPKFPNKTIPVASAIVGIILAVAGMLAFPSEFVCESIQSAIIVGAVSGFAATGTDQVYRQLKQNCQNSIKETIDN